MSLTPPDPKRCQSMVPNGYTFMSFGGVPGLERCSNPPVVIAEEVEAAHEDGQTGSMSLCLRCLCVLSTQERKMWANTRIKENNDG